MKKLLISTAFGLLATISTAYAQEHHDDHGGPGAQHGPAGPGAAPHAPAPHGPAPGGPAGAHGPAPHAMAPHAAPAPHAMAAPHAAPQARQQEDHRNSAGRQSAPGARPAMIPPAHNAGPANHAGNNRPGNNNFGNNSRNDSRFSAMHRNFNAPRHYHAPAYRRPSGWYAHSWTFGQVLPSLFWAQDYWLNDYGTYGLDSPPPGTVWVRDGDDALLIDRSNGEIIQVEYSVFD